MSVGFKINPPKSGPYDHLVHQFENIPVANIDDAMSRTAALGSGIRSINNKKMVGVAYPLRVPAGDNLLFYYALDHAKAGDVIVVDGGGFCERALCGEIMATYAKKRGLSGFVINGAIRDYAALQELDFPVFARAISPNGPYKNGPGVVNTPVALGGRMIYPGDIMVGDDTGIINIRPCEAEKVLKQAQKIKQHEHLTLAKIKREGKFDLDWVTQKLAASDCEINE